MRAQLDKLVSWFGIALAVVLVVAGALLTWGQHFTETQVHDQLAAQKIFFPPADSPAVQGAEFAPVRQYGGQQLLTGKQAEVYADHFIAVHLSEIGGGKTYAELSTEANANPDDQALAGKVATMFKGETLRGLLLNAYAFGTIGTIAGIAAVGAFIAAGVMLILALLGFWHAGRQAPTGPEARAREHERV